MSKKRNRNAVQTSNKQIYPTRRLNGMQAAIVASVTEQMALRYKGHEKELAAKYIHEAWTLKKEINLPEESVYNVWFNMDDEEMRGQFLKHVFSDKNFNPYTDKLPVESMPDELKNTVMAIQVFLKENYGKNISFRDEHYRHISLYYRETDPVSLIMDLWLVNEIIMSKYCFVGIWFQDDDMAGKVHGVLNKRYPDDWKHVYRCVYTNSHSYGGYFLKKENIEALWKEALEE